MLFRSKGELLLRKVFFGDPPPHIPDVLDAMAAQYDPRPSVIDAPDFIDTLRGADLHVIAPIFSQPLLSPDTDPTTVRDRREILGYVHLGVGLDRPLQATQPQQGQHWLKRRQRRGRQLQLRAHARPGGLVVRPSGLTGSPGPGGLAAQLVAASLQAQLELSRLGRRAPVGIPCQGHAGQLAREQLQRQTPLGLGVERPLRVTRQAVGAAHACGPGQQTAGSKRCRDS